MPRPRKAERWTVGAAALAVFAPAGAAAQQACSDILFNSSSHVPNDLGSTGIMSFSDPTTLRNVSYEGRGERTVYDARVEGSVTFNAYLFNVQYDAGTVEFIVNPEAGSLETARVKVDDFADALGRLPAVLLSELTVVIHVDDWRAAYGGSGGIIVYSAAGESLQDGVHNLLVHEATHALLDPEHSRSTGWVAAQRADDGRFVSQYACLYPEQEDFAETFVFWFVVQYLPEILTPEQYRWVLATIPNRLAYLDQQGFDMSPYRPATPVPALPAAAVIILAVLLAGLRRGRSQARA